MEPIVHGLEADYYQKINFVFLDVDDPANDEFKKALGYRYQPHFFLLDGEGEIIQQWIGIVAEEDFREAFDSALEK
jgi:thioredoxin-related protein